jgi:ELWxxDGT repeat protein
MYPRGLTIVAGSVFFTASDGVSGRELWVSDGTEAGTALVRDINPVSDPWGSYGPYSLASAGSLLLFAADDGTRGYELWRSDGTTAGTALAKDIWTTTAGSGPRDLVTFGGYTYFAANGDGGWALWRSDGTPAGTTSLMTTPAAGCWRGVGDLTVAIGRLVFLVCDEGRVSLWTSDGTVIGTARLATFEYAWPPVEFKGAIYFAGYQSDSNVGLWKSDGTAAGTVRIGDKYPANLTVVGDSLYFSADDATVGWELWKTDGTASGTVLVKDIYPGYSWGTYPNSSYPRKLMALDDQRLVFFAWTAEYGVEPWTSDGTEAGTHLVRDISPGEFGSTMMPEDNDDLYGDRGPIFTKYQGRLWFVACDTDAGCEPWSTDGTSAGTTRLKDIYPGPYGSAVSYFMWGMYPRYSGPRFGVFNGRVYFGAYSGGSGFELWSSDGTEGGTHLVKDLLPGDGYVANLFDSFTPAGDALYLIGCKSNGYDRFQDCNLWQTDGTASGTELALTTPLSLDSIGDYYFNGRSRMTVADGNLYVPATDDEHGAELFRVPLAVDPVQLLGALYGKVLGVSAGRSLSSKVAQARALVGNNRLKAACGMIRAFANEVRAQRGKLLSLGAADALIGDSEAIGTVIGCN